MSDQVEKPAEQTPAPEPTPTPTAEELKAQTEVYIKEMWDNEALDRHKKKDTTDYGYPEPKPVEEKKEEPKPGATAPEPPKPGEKPAEPKPEPAPPKSGTRLSDLAEGDPIKPKEEPKPGEEPAPEPERKPVQIQPIDDDDLAEKIVKRLEKKQTPAAPTTPEDPFKDYSPKEQKQLQALQYLSKKPEYQGRDLAREAITFWKREEDYMNNWRRANPGKKFTSDDDEHLDFYEANELNIDDETILSASVDMRIEAQQKSNDKVLEENKKLREEQKQAREKEEQNRRIAEAAPAITKVTRQAVHNLIASIPEFTDLVKEGKVTPEIEAKMAEVDPETVEILNEEAQLLHIRVEELEYLRHFGGGLDLNKRVQMRDEHGRPTGPVDAPHSVIYEVGLELEQRILQMPPEKQAHNGKRFMPRAEFGRRMDLIAKDQKLSEDEKAQRMEALEDRVWTITADDVRDGIIAKSRANVQKARDRLNRRVQRLSAPKPKEEPKGPKKTDPKPDETKTRSGSSAPPASLASQSDIVDTGKIRSEEAKKDHQVIADAMW